MDVGINGTAKVGKLKTLLKGERQKNTLCQKDLRRQIGIFKELVKNDAEPKPSKLLNGKLKKYKKPKNWSNQLLIQL